MPGLFSKLKRKPRELREKIRDGVKVSVALIRMHNKIKMGENTGRWSGGYFRVFR